MPVYHGRFETLRWAPSATAFQWVLEHLRSDLCRGRRHCDNVPFLVEELPGEKGNVFPASHNAPSSDKAAGSGRPKELNVQVRRGSEVTGAKTGDKRGSERVVKHGGQESTLNGARRIQERLAGCKCNLDRPLFRADRHQFPAERGCRRGQRNPACHCIPERTRARHGNILAGTSG
jgi:hypothetical protein